MKSNTKTQNSTYNGVLIQKSPNASVISHNPS